MRSLAHILRLALLFLIAGGSGSCSLKQPSRPQYIALGWEVKNQTRVFIPQSIVAGSFHWLNCLYVEKIVRCLMEKLFANNACKR